MENFVPTIFNFNEFIKFIFLVNIIFICAGEIYLLTYLENVDWKRKLQLKRPSQEKIMGKKYRDSYPVDFTLQSR